MTKAALAEGNIVHFWCPACDDAHMIRFGGDSWTWNGDLEAPSFTPSVKVTGVQWERQYPFFKPRHHVEPGQPICCHSWVTDGRIRFYADSTHDLAGQTVDLPEWPYGDELEAAPEDSAPPKGSTMTINFEGRIHVLDNPDENRAVVQIGLTGGTVPVNGQDLPIVGGLLVVIVDDAGAFSQLELDGYVTGTVEESEAPAAPVDAAPAAPVEDPAPAPAEPQQPDTVPLAIQRRDVPEEPAEEAAPAVPATDGSTDATAAVQAQIDEAAQSAPVEPPSPVAAPTPEAPVTDVPSGSTETEEVAALPQPYAAPAEESAPSTDAAASADPAPASPEAPAASPEPPAAAPQSGAAW